MNYRSLRMMQEDQPDKGTLQIQVNSLRQDLPIADAEIDISYTGAPDDVLERVQTNSSGQTETLELPTPPVEYSLEPEQETQPYSEYTLRISAAGYETITISGTQLLSGQNALQNIRMRPLDQPVTPDVIVIPAHTLYGE